MAINLDAILKISAQVGGTDQVLKMKSALEQLGLEMDDTGKISNRYAAATKNATASSALFTAGAVALGGVMKDAAYAAAQFLQQSVGLGFEFAQTETRLKMLSGQYGEFDQVQQVITANASMLGISQMEASKGFADIYARLKPLGTSLEDVNAVYVGFNSLAIQSGTTAAAASGAFMQLSQALGSGTLRGDEFNSVAEQVPGILNEVAKVMDRPVGALRGLAAEGKITSDVVIQAMRNAASEGGSNLDALSQSAANAGSRLSVAFQDAQARIGKEFVPMLAPVMDLLAGIASQAAQVLPPAINAANAELEVMGFYLENIKNYSPAMAELGLNLGALAQSMGLWATQQDTTTQGTKNWVQELFNVDVIMQQIADSQGPVIGGMLRIFNNPQVKEWAETIRGILGYDKARLDVLDEQVLKWNEQIEKTSEIKSNAELIRAEIVRTNEEAAKAAQAAQTIKNEAKQIKEQIQQANALLDAGNDQEKAKLGILEQEARMRLEKAKTIGDEFAALKNIRDISLQQAKLDYDAARQKIQAQVDLGRMLDSEARIRLETLKIQYQQTQATINQAFEAEKTRASEAEINKLKKDSLATTEQTVAATQDLAAASQEVAAAVNATADGYKAVSVASSSAADSVSGYLNAESLRLVTAQAAYKAEQRRADQIQKLNDLYAEGTQAAKEYAEALLAISTAEFVQEFRVAQAADRRSAVQNQFAAGGYVTRPTIGLIGEGGESEYVIPESKMAAASAGYLTGARGADVLNAPSVPSAQGSGSGGGGSAVVPDPKINVMIQTGPVMQNKDGTWVTMEDFQRGVQEAMVTTTRQIYAALQQPTIRNSLAF